VLAHESSCGLAASCEGCNRRFAKADLAVHLRSCTGFRACSFCKSRMLPANVAAHERSCPEVATCSVCNHRVAKNSLADHQIQCCVHAPFSQQTLAAQSDGMKIVMYHGTSERNAASIRREGRFRPSTGGMLGRGVYLSKDVQKAKHYGPVIFRCLVSVGRVKKIDRQGHPLQKTWQTNGYNTAWVPPRCGMVPSGLEENCVLDPDRIQILGAL